MAAVTFVEDDVSGHLNAYTMNPSSPMLKTVVHMIDDNVAHFSGDDSEFGARLQSGLGALKDNLVRSSELVEVVKVVAPLYDFKPSVPGNGFRSLCTIVQQATGRVFELNKQICVSRDSFFFKKSHYAKEIEAWGQALASIAAILDYVVETLLENCKNGNLYPDISSTPEELIVTLNSIAQYAFYGRCLAFQYYETLHKILKVINITMCTFSEVYYSDQNLIQRTTQSVLTGTKYLMDPELRSRRIVDVLQYSGIDFLKSFWSMHELDLLSQLPRLVGNVAVQQVIVVPCESQDVLSHADIVVTVPAPQSHFGPRPITCHLFSAHLREGMPGEKDVKGSSAMPPSSQLIIHCHGGGFVTQSTKGQEAFLREWATFLDVPLLSIDYSLAPEAAYPRPLEEVLTVYCWARNNARLLGTTGKTIILTGDSAGGNLVTGVTIKCLELGIPPPDGLFLAYTPFNFDLLPTPSRLLAVMDPLLPLGFAMRCLKAYAGQHEESSLSLASDLGFVTAGDLRTEASSDTESFVMFTEGDVREAELKVETEVQVVRELGHRGIADKEVREENSEETEASAEGLEQKDARRLSLVSEAESDTLTTISLNSTEGSFREEPGGKHKKDGEGGGSRKEYVTQFLNRYVLDSRKDKQGHLVPILRTGGDDSEGDEDTILFEASSSSSAFGNRLGKARQAMATGLTSLSTSLSFRRKLPSEPIMKEAAKEPVHLPVDKCHSLGRLPLGNCDLYGGGRTLLDEFKGIKLINDYYLSPLHTPREILARFPPTIFLTTEYDFCLDDGVTMARLLDSLGVRVELEVLERLPHGFLNLSQLCSQSHSGCKRAMVLIGSLLRTCAIE